MLQLSKQWKIFFIVLAGGVSLAGIGFYFFYYQPLVNDAMSRSFIKAIEDPCLSHLISGRSSERQERYEEAMAIYTKGIELCSEQPALTNLKLHLGSALLKTHREGEARKIFDELLALNSNDAQAHLGLSFYYLQKDDKEEALRQLRSLVKIT